MAVYETGSRRVRDPSKPYGEGIIINYIVDAQADIDRLPGIDRISGGSVALIRTTGRRKILTEEGWADCADGAAGMVNWEVV